MSKAANGITPCVCCMNSIGRRRPADIARDRAVHFSQAGPDDFRLHDAASFARMLEEVRRVMENPASRAKDKREIQTLCGINYSSTGMGVIWGPAQDLAQVPECICYDWMHNVCASGGVGAHHVNQLVRVVAQAGVTLADITAFIQKVVQPKSNRTLRSFKFEQRIADTSSAPIRAFASEVLSLVPALALMCDVVLGGFDPLREHVACFLLLARTLDILTHNNDTLDFLPLLGTLLRQYHKSFCKLLPWLRATK